MKPSSKKTKEFIAAYDEHADAVFRYCFFKLSNRELAKDMVQDTFIKTWQYLGEGKPIGNLKAFLYKVAHNLIIDEYRRQKASSLDSLREAGFDVEGSRGDDMILSAEADVVLRAIDKLEPHFREVIVMRYVHDLSPREIADILGEKENAVSVRLNRAIHKAQELLNIQS
jgi:RNA polymerase sigma-70 factor, ECF subfamily